MDRGPRAALAGLGQERVLPRPEAQRVVRQDAWTRHGGLGSRRLPGHCAAVYRRHPVGAFGDITER